MTVKRILLELAAVDGLNVEDVADIPWDDPVVAARLRLRLNHALLVEDSSRVLDCIRFGRDRELLRMLPRNAVGRTVARCLELLSEGLSSILGKEVGSEVPWLVQTTHLLTMRATADAYDEADLASLLCDIELSMMTYYAPPSNALIGDLFLVAAAHALFLAGAKRPYRDVIRKGLPTALRKALGIPINGGDSLDEAWAESKTCEALAVLLGVPFSASRPATRLRALGKWAGPSEESRCFLAGWRLDCIIPVVQPLLGQSRGVCGGALTYAIMKDMTVAEWVTGCRTGVLKVRSWIERARGSLLRFLR